MPNLSKNLSDDTIPNEILQFISASPTKITSIKLEKILSEQYKLEKEQIKSVIRDLVKRGELVYTYEYGRSFLECSFNKPVRVSNFVVIKPPGYHYRPDSGDIVIQIKPGASFGDGRHPTTRLAIRAIEVVLKEIKFDDPELQHSVLDIGTGTGILAMTAMCLGIHKGIGIDIDPCARSEAKENLKINGLEDRIGISDQYLETIDQFFSLVTANLRFPTLKKIGSCLRKITIPKGFVVFSGIRCHESANLINAYTRKGFECLWQDHELDWEGIVFRKLK
jgi:ribosomal protein L11 methyltransferase